MSALPETRDLALVPLAAALQTWRGNDESLGPLPPSLAELPRFLSPISKTLNQEAKEAVEDVRERLIARLPAYPPRLYETMLSEAALLLNRCEAYRREGEEVASLAIREAFALISREASRRISLRSINTNLADAERQRSSDYLTASEQYADPGAREQARGDGEFYSASASSFKTRAELAELALAIEQTHDEALIAQFTFPGGALDYVGRYRTIATLLREDVSEAYERLMAASIGLSGPAAGLGDQVPALPVPTEDATLPILDELIRWTRGAMRTVDRERLRDQEMFICLPIISDDELNPPGTGTKFFPNKNAAIETLVSTGRCNFVIQSDDLPSGCTAFRILTIGLSHQKDLIRLEDMARGPERDRGVSPPPKATESRAVEVSMLLAAEDTRSYSATITPPRQSFDGFPTTEAKTDLHLGQFGAFTSFGAAGQVNGPLITNESPLGDWTITIHRDGINVWGTEKIATDVFDGLILHLTLLARPIV